MSEVPLQCFERPATHEEAGQVLYQETGERRRRVVNVKVIDSGLSDHTLVGPLRERYHESRRCSRDTYPESSNTKYTSMRRKNPQ